MANRISILIIPDKKATELLFRLDKMRSAIKRLIGPGGVEEIIPQKMAAMKAIITVINFNYKGSPM